MPSAAIAARERSLRQMIVFVSASVSRTTARIAPRLWRIQSGAWPEPRLSAVLRPFSRPAVAQARAASQLLVLWPLVCRWITHCAAACRSSRPPNSIGVRAGRHSGRRSRRDSPMSSTRQRCAPLASSWPRSTETWTDSPPYGGG